MKIPENLNQEQIDALTNLLKSFEVKEEKLINGWYICDGNVYETVNNPKDERSKIIWATKEQAEACLAMSELSQLMKEANADWQPDYMSNETKHTIVFNSGVLVKERCYNYSDFLAFKTVEIRDEFLNKNKELILKAKTLL